MDDRGHRILLSGPHVGPDDREFLLEAFDSNWITPLGPQVDAFEREFAERVGAKHALALSSGTAALHLALREVGVEPGDEVVVSDLTFVASVNPVLYLGAAPIFVGSEESSWNMDPELLEEALLDRLRKGARVSAVVAVHLYGQPASLEAIQEVCRRYDVPLVEDAAEALGAVYHSRDGGQESPGLRGRCGIYSFNGNKMITTSGGGMLVSDDEALIEHARKLAAQAREPFPHYEHSEVGYNYRLSNLLAAVGRAQLGTLDHRVEARRRIFERYRETLGEIPGVSFQPEAPWATHCRWLSCMTVDPQMAGVDREGVRTALERENIEARPLWKPMHMQPLFRECPVYDGSLGRRLFEDGLCVPSGSGLAPTDQDRVIRVIRRSVRSVGAGRA